MEDRMKCKIAVYILLILLAGCSSKKSTTPSPSAYTLSGRVTNQFGNAAIGLQIRITGPSDYQDSTTTDSIGAYSISGLPKDTVTVFIGDSSDVVIYNIPRLFMPLHAHLYIVSDTVINTFVDEFTTIFHDPGNGATLWNFHGSVVNDGTKYIFSRRLSSTYMTTNDSYLVPANTFINGFIIYGEAAEPDSSNVIASFMVNDVPINAHWRRVFTTTPSYYSGYIGAIHALPGDSIKLTLSFYPLNADSVNIRDIWLFSY